MKKPRNRLAYLRMTNIMSQKDMADYLGISQTYYCKLEKYPEKIDLGMAAKIKEKLGAKTIDELLESVS